MTVAVAGWSAQGLVIGADTQITSELKQYRSKITLEKAGNGSLLIAYDGPTDEAEHACDRCMEALNDGGTLTAGRMARKLEETIRQEAHDFQWSLASYPPSPAFIFVLFWADHLEAFWAQAPHYAFQRFKAIYAAIGSGATIAKVFMESLHAPGARPDNLVDRIAFALWQAKRYDAYCGGESTIYKFNRIGSIELVPQQYLKRLEDAYGRIELHRTETLKTILDFGTGDDTFKQAMRGSEKELLSIRRDLMSWVMDHYFEAQVKEARKP